tara:strand:- start:1071 stop:1928 length:858 start_codon:yes stop_codon:yes gene_type:complete
MRKIVDFFIVGAPKAGTTSLYEYLKQHSVICMSTIKEPDFFTKDELLKNPLYYGKNPIENIEDYHDLFDDSNCQIRGEASVSYLFYPLVAKKIKQYNTNAKIIIMLRNPVDRAFSHYLMDYKLGLVDQDFESIFNKSDSLFFQQYFEIGNYYEQVMRYLSNFDKDRIQIIWYEDFVEFGTKELQKTYKFLSVNIKKNTILQTKHNAFSLPKNKIIRKVYSMIFLRRLLKNILPVKFTSIVKKNLFSDSKKPILCNKLRKKIIKYYINDIEKLEKAMNKNLILWKK